LFQALPQEAFASIEKYDLWIYRMGYAEIELPCWMRSLGLVIEKLSHSHAALRQKDKPLPFYRFRKKNSSFGTISAQ
jgi:hypothetical protein